MRETTIVATALALFVAGITFPVWRAAYARPATTAPILRAPSKAKGCVAPREYMRTSHMVLLARWKDDAVRRGDRLYVAYDGHLYTKSLVSTCIKCHESKAEFCDRCHDYAGVNPKCGDCHVVK